MGTSLVEYATLNLAALAGITVAPTQVLSLSGLQAGAIRRFDQMVGGSRIHSVSRARSFGLQLLKGRNRRWITQSRRLLRRMLSHILTDKTDDHEKSYSLLVVSPFQHVGLRLAPAYDLLPTHSGQGC